MGKLLAAGDIAQDFELPVSGGALLRLSDFVSQGKAVLLFYRGNW